jgi:hypothetical protein
VVFSRKGFPRKNRVSYSILFSHYLLTSGIRAWYGIRFKKLGFHLARCHRRRFLITGRIWRRTGGPSAILVESALDV